MERSTSSFQRSKPWGLERGTVIVDVSHCPNPLGGETRDKQ